MNTLVAVAIAPFGVGDELSKEVAEVVKVIRDSGLPNKTYSMFTEIEGEWDEVMKVVKNATFVLAEKGIRTEVIMKMDIRPGYNNMMTEKIDRMENQMQNKQKDKKMKFDISKYLILGRENTKNRTVEEVVKSAVEAGFTFIQIRSKEESAVEMIEDCLKVSALLKKMGKNEQVSLVVNDRLDVILAARERGAKIDGIHVGQTDIPVDICRKYLGKDSIIGLSAPTKDLISYVKSYNVKDIDYFGAGPVHETATKPDCGRDETGKVITKPLEELAELAKISPVPVVVGGGVKLKDIKPLKQSGIDGFFVITAITDAQNPYTAAKELCDAWKN